MQGGELSCGRARIRRQGAKCLVARENVCQAEEDGGLGIKRIDTQNACLLLKLIHRVHHFDGSAWARWMKDHIRLSDLEGGLAGTHWNELQDLLPAYRSFTKVTVGDGRETDF
jgi:hypothetical protein